jgi:hypothetical protein
MHSSLHAWTATLQIGHDSLKVLVRDPDGEDVLRAEFCDHPHHSSALLTLLEGVALWRGTPLCAVIFVEHVVTPSLGVGGWDNPELWPSESALVSLRFVDPRHRPRRLAGQSR